MKTTKRFKTIDEYIKVHPKDVAAKLKIMRGIVHKVDPKAVEVISYNMPAFKLEGQNGVLIYFAAHTHHIGLYPFPSAIKAFQQDSAMYKTARGSIQFPNDQKLPVALITKIVKYRVGEKSEKK